MLTVKRVTIDVKLPNIPCGLQYNNFYDFASIFLHYANTCFRSTGSSHLFGDSGHLPLDAVIPEKVLDVSGDAVAPAPLQRPMRPVPQLAIVLRRLVRRRRRRREKLKQIPSGCKSSHIEAHSYLTKNYRSPYL